MNFNIFDKRFEPKYEQFIELIADKWVSVVIICNHSI